MTADVVQAAMGIACVPLLLVEQVLAAKWSAIYFRSGVPLFRQRVNCTASVDLDRIEENLNLALERRFWQPLIFRRLHGEVIAFRERFWPFPIYLDYYLPIMHGHIRRLDSQRVEIQGKSNWAVLLLCAFITLGAYRESGPELAAVGVGFLVVMYGLQLMRFRRVAHLAGLTGIQHAA